MAERLVFDVLAKASGTQDLQRLGSALDDIGKSADNLGKKGGVGGALFKDVESEANAAESKIGSFFKNIFSRSEKDADSAGKSIGSKLLGSIENLGNQTISVGTKIGTGISQGIEGALGGAGPLTPVLLGAAAVAAPLMGGVIAGGIIAAVGAAGIGGIIALSLENPDVRAAADNLGNTFESAISQSVKPFKQDVLDAFQILDQQSQTTIQNIQTLFANTAPSIAPLTQNVAAALNSITTGIANLSAGAAPVLSALGEGVAMVGAAIGAGFSSLADDGAAAATALTATFILIAAGVRGLFAAVDGLTEAFGFLAEKGILGPGLQASYEQFRQKLDGVKQSMDGTRSSTEAATTALTAQANQVKAQTDPLFGVITAQQNLATAQKKAADATRDYGASSTQAKDANLELAKAALGMQQASAKAGDTFSGTLTPAMRATLSAAGLTGTQIASVEKSMQQAAKAGQDYGQVYQADLKLNGTDGVVAGAASARRAIDAIPSQKIVQVILQQVGVAGAAVARAQGGIDLKMAAGGAITSHFVRSPTVMYGERGDEAYIAKDAPIGRSRSIAEQVVEKWLGGKVTWPGGGGTGSGGPAPRSAGHAATGMDTAGIERAVSRGIARGMADIAINFDGRQFAAIQGRDADLRARAG